MSNSTSNLDLISVAQSQKEVTANDLFNAASPAMLFGRRAQTSGGLTWGYYGGAMMIGGTPTAIGNGTLLLTASATNYLEADPATGTVSKNTTGFTGGMTPLYSVVVGTTTVTSYTDFRTGGGGTGGAGVTDGDKGDLTVDGDTWTIDPEVISTFGRTLTDDADAATARATLGLGTVATLAADTDTALTANSDTKVATQKAVKAYVDAIATSGATDVMIFKGVIDASTNPNFPAGDAGHLYKISVAGKIGGASGTDVGIGDTIYCITDGSAAGTLAAVGANWNIAEANETTATAGALISSATAKSTPVDTDFVGLMDSAASNVLKKLSWANIKATLKAYFDTLYVATAFAVTVTTKGDLQTFSTAPARLGVGADGQVLTADSTQPTGLKWATASSGGSSTSIAGTNGTTGGDATATGGTSSTSGIAGGGVILTGGTPGATAAGGVVSAIGGPGGTTSGAGGAVSMTGGPGTASTATGGTASLIGGAPGATGIGGTAAVTGGAGGATSGAGGQVLVTGGSATAGAGGAVTVKGGTGAGGVSLGGAVLLQGGNGPTAGDGGPATVQGGTGGSSATGGVAFVKGGSGLLGGAVTVVGGAGTGGAGGAASMTGGAGAGNGAGGASSITGGAGAGAGNGGNVVLTPGAGGASGVRGNVVLNGTGAALATNATGGFTCIPTCAGAPTGTPASIPTGTVPMVFDSTNFNLYVYVSGAWKKTSVFA